MAPDHGVTGIVLAGGTSRRFGRDKLQEPIEGEPMLHRAIHSLAPLCQEVLVSVAHVGEPPTVPEDVQVVMVRDRRPEEGPLMGLSTALAEAAHPMALVVGGDMPYVHTAVLALLLAALADPTASVACLSDDESLRPLPCALRSAEGDRLRGFVDAGERRLRTLIREFPVTTVPDGTWRALDPEAASLRDIDRPGDLPLEKGGCRMFPPGA